MAKTTQTPGTVLLSLMQEYQLNPYTLSREISLSHSAIRQIITGKSKLSIPAALRFAKFFGQTPAYWLNLQCSVDLQEAENDKGLQDALKKIKKALKPTASAKAKTPAKPSKKTSATKKSKGVVKAPKAKPSK